jgi:hypothetical protein
MIAKVPDTVLLLEPGNLSIIDGWPRSVEPTLLWKLVTSNSFLVMDYSLP